MRQFFALLNRHVRWELNDLARRLDEQPDLVELHDDKVAAPPSSGLVVTPNGRRMLQAIDQLPEDHAMKTLAAAVVSYDRSAARATEHNAWIARILRREAETLILPNRQGFNYGFGSK